MRNKLFCLTVIGVLALTSSVQAATWANWTGAAGDRDWNNGENWDTGEVPPATGVFTIIDDVSGPIVSDGMEVVVDRVYAGRNQDEGVLIVDGGRFSFSSNLYLSGGDNTTGIVYLYRGIIEDTSGSTNLNWKGKGILNMYGGTFTVPGDIRLTQNQASNDTTLNLYGGTMDIGGIGTPHANRTGALINVQGGTLLLNGDDLAAMQTLIDEGVLMAYNGDGDLAMDFDVSNAGKTTVTASHPYVPSPADGSLVSPGAITLSWALPADVEKVDVWFTDDLDQIFNANPEALLVDQKLVSSADVTAEIKKRYYWAVDIYTGSEADPNYGSIFSFLADNAPPLVMVGEDYEIFLKEGKRNGALVGSVTDDGVIEPYTVLWEVLEQPSDNNDPNNPDDPDNVPSAVIADAEAEETTITVSAVGRYVVRMTANDGEYTGDDQLVINAFEDTWDE